MKNIQITLDIELEDDIATRENIYDVTRNVAEALLHEINTKGLIPDKCETFTKEIVLTGEHEAFLVNPSDNTVTSL